MTNRNLHPSQLPLVMLCALLSSAATAENELAIDEQRAMQAAVKHVSPSIVQIRTVGGMDRVGSTHITQGPTTGLIVSTEGYIVSSAFNFVQQPSSILVRMASGKQVPAELVARDKNRMLVLLKVKVEESLPVPEATPYDEIRVGQWSVAAGRTFHNDRVAVSVGIVSAVNRMYGRVVQTDANVSVANYGGPLIDITGRVLGVLVPMSPQSAGGEGSELAGTEFYDSGIGFAVPLEHVLGILDRWREGKDLLPGKLGVGLKKGGGLFELPEISSVWQGSPAAEAGWKPKDVIVAVDGQPIDTQSQLRFQLVPRYAGDKLLVTVRRGNEQLQSKVTLTGKLAAFRRSFLGVLPMRNESGETESGVTVRGIWPKSPAARAGLKQGDRITKLGEYDIKNLSEALESLSGFSVDSSVSIEFERKGKKRTLKAKLAETSNEILPRGVLSRGNRAARDGRSQVAELKPLRLLQFAQTVYYYAPRQDGASGSRGLLLWLSSSDPADNQMLFDAWKESCDRDGLVLVVAHSSSASGWVADDAAFLVTLLRTLRRRFDLDPHRAVICGSGKAGQLAYALALRTSNGLSGAIGIDAPLPRTLRLPPSLPGRRLALLTVESKNSSFAPLIRRDIERLREAGYAASWLERDSLDGADGQLSPEARDGIARWIDGLDRF